MSQPRRDARLLDPPSAGARSDPRGRRRVHSTRLGRAGRSALHPGIRARLVGTALLPALLSLALLPVAACAAPRDTTGTVVGWVRDSLSGRALPGASVVVQGTHLAAVADTGGWFRLERVPAGERVIQAYSIGFEPDLARIRVRPALADTVRLRLRAFSIGSTIRFDSIGHPRPPVPPNHR